MSLHKCFSSAVEFGWLPTFEILRPSFPGANAYSNFVATAHFKFLVSAFKVTSQVAHVDFGCPQFSEQVYFNPACVSDIVAQRVRLSVRCRMLK